LFQNSLARAAVNRVPLWEGNNLSDAETYKRYADECLRIAEKMTGKDREALLQIAEAWRSRAQGIASIRKGETEGDTTPVQ
jgi:hypothetical protein